MPVTPGPQLTFPSLQDGASFRVPQRTEQNRLQFGDTFTLVRGAHTLNFGGEVQRRRRRLRPARLSAGPHRAGRRLPRLRPQRRRGVDDNDLLFAVTLRSACPDRPLVIPDADNNYFALFFQDDWRVTRNLTLNLGLRYELDTDVKNVSRVDELNPLILPFLRGERSRDKNNFAPRVGFN